MDVKGGFSGVAANGHGTLSSSTTNGAMITGYGSSYDSAILNRSGSVVAGNPSNSSYFYIGVSEYADNTAAVSAGLPVGALYRTVDALKIVH